jgi:hypothetical protein
MVKINDLELKAKNALVECLQDVPFLKVINLDSVDGSDVRLILQHKGQKLLVIVELKNNGEPRYARQAVDRILRSLPETGGDYGIFIAPYISSRAAQICREENVGYLDLAGNCHISFESIYIHKEGMPNPFTRKRYLASLFSPKAERVLRVLLASGHKLWKMEQLSNEAQVSLGQVSNVKKLLADQEWIDAKTVGFSLSDPFSLLEEWAQNYRYRRSEVLDFYTMLGVGEFEYKLDEICRSKNIQYALTGFSASSRYAPAVRYQRAMAYIQDQIDALVAALEIKPVGSGANVMILRPYDAGVFYGTQEISGSKVVSPVQNYLDLSSYRGRGDEAAEVLFDKVIRKLW